MHDAKKVNKNVIGELPRRRNNKVVNQFPDGTNLIQSTQDMAKHFYSSYSKNQNFKTLLSTTPHFPDAKIERDLNDTRVSARYQLLRSSLRLKSTILKYYELYWHNFLSMQ